MKKIKKLFLPFLSVLLILGISSCGKNKKITNQYGLITSDPYFSDEKFNPVVRFTVSSDVHFGNTRTELYQIVKKMLDFSYEIADSSSYKKVDLAIFAGDLVDNGADYILEYFKDELYSSLKEETIPFIVMGNHDFRTFGDKSQSVYENILNIDLDRHEIINGFHFIGISPINETTFGKEKVEWLDNELKKASQDDPNKPIFVIQHMNVKGTVVGSNDWGVSELTSTLSKYPQVIDFSGHSHFSIKDPRSIWQGDFTALGTGVMYYYELGINDYKEAGLFPIDEFGGYSPTAEHALSGAEFYLVEVDSNNAVRITGYDIFTKTKICSYGIKKPSDKSSFIYTNIKKEKESKEPFFDKKQVTEITVEKDSMLLKVKQAYSKDLLESYRAYVYKGDKKVNTYYALSGYYLNPMPEYVYINLLGLESNVEYTIKIYAVNVFGKVSSKPLVYKVTTL